MAAPKVSVDFAILGLSQLELVDTVSFAHRVVPALDVGPDQIEDSRKTGNKAFPDVVFRVETE